MFSEPTYRQPCASNATHRNTSVFWCVAPQHAAQTCITCCAAVSTATTDGEVRLRGALTVAQRNRRNSAKKTPNCDFFWAATQQMLLRPKKSIDLTNDGALRVRPQPRI